MRRNLRDLSLRSITFGGLKRVESQSLADHLQLEQIRPSLINPELSMIEERVEAHPWVKKASDTLGLQGTIHVSVEEYRAAAIAVLDELYLVTPNGVPFAPARASDLNGELTMISGVSAELFKQSQKSSLIGHYWLKRGIELSTLVKESGLPASHRLSDVHISETGPTRSSLIRLGSRLGLILVERLAKVNRLLNRLERKGVSAAYILLSDDLSRAIVKGAISPQEESHRRTR